MLVSLTVTWLQIAHPPRPIPELPILDASIYVSSAHQLTTEGTFGAGQADDHAPAMFFAPLYPAFLAGLMALDHDLADMAGCVRNSANRSTVEAMTCRHYKGIAVPVQAVLAIACGFMVWAAGTMLAGRQVGWLALILTLATAQYAFQAPQFLTENLVLPLFSAAMLTLLAGLRQGRPWQWLATGALLGLLTLTRPEFSYLAAAAILTAVCASLRLKSSALIKAALWMLAGCLAVVFPWLLRNWMTFGRIAVTAGYDSYILVQRLNYNFMTPGEWLLSFLYWQPDVGQALATHFWPPEAWQRLGWDHPQAFYNTPWPYPGDLDYQLRNHLLPNLGWHLVTTLALAWRGLWLMRWWGLLCIPAAAAGMVLAARRRRWVFLIFCAPAWFMLGFHAFVSVNAVRYNLIMLPALTIMAAWALLEAWRRASGQLLGKATP